MVDSISYTLVIVNYNGAKYIGACIESFFVQDIRPSEIIVVDNNSTDNSVSVLSNFAEIKLICNKKNHGYAASLNQGIKNCSHPYIVFINPDVYVDKEWSTHIFKPFLKYKECGLSAPKVLYWDEPERINSTGMLFYKDLSAVNRGLDEIDNGQYDNDEELFGAYGAMMVFRREVIDQVGWFDEDYWLYREEDEYMWRMQMHGWKTRFAYQAKIFHKRSANTGLFSPLKLYYSERNRFWNVIKFMPLRCTFTMLPYVVARYFANFSIILSNDGSKKAVSLKKKSKIYLLFIIAKAWFAGMIGLPAMFVKRRRILRTTTIGHAQCLKYLDIYKAALSDLVK